MEGKIKYIEFEFKDKIQKVWVEKQGEEFWLHFKGRTFIYNPYKYEASPEENELKKEDIKRKTTPLNKEKKKKEREGEEKSKENTWSFRAPLSGKVTQIFVKPKDLVQKGDRILVLEAMKMEYNFKAEKKAQVVQVKVSEDSFVEAHEEIFIFKESL